MQYNYRSALLKASRLVGGQKQLAQQLHITPSRLNKWINRSKSNQGIPYGYALAIEKITHGEVSCFELIPEWEKIVAHCLKQYSGKDHLSQRTASSCPDGVNECHNEKIRMGQ